MKSDDFFRDVYSLQDMHDSKNRLQKMVCLPEKYIYGWILSLNSQSEELKAYKKECYNILFNYFHGTITGRKELLKQKVETDIAMSEAEAKLLQTEEYKAFQNLKEKQTKISKSLKTNDLKATEEIKTLFNYDN